MLQSLSVENYALIDKLNIEFKQGLNIITGETGAGKSILLGALGLILGQRADTSTLKNPEKSCIIEGIFNIEKMNLAKFFEGNDIEYDKQAAIRRLITPSGKSRAFINDTPVNLTTLRDFGLMLIDIHSQHETLLISNHNFQMNVLDVAAGNNALLLQYQQTFASYKKEDKKLQDLIEEQNKSAADFDYYTFQYQQLADANLAEEEQEALEEEEKELSNAETIKTELQFCSEAISESDMAIIHTLKSCQQSVRRIKDVFHKSESILERLDSISIEIKDISDEIINFNEKIEINPERLRQVKERLDLLYTLQQKHRVSSVAELLSLRDEFESKLSLIANFDEQIEKQRMLTSALHAETKALAIQLSEKRKSVTEQIHNYIEHQLSELGMPHAKVQIDINETELTNTGIDKVEFLFSANKLLPLQSVAKVASGGEMSRLMLSIKTLLAKKGDLPTIIFDEIDTGVSGEVADKMGSIIKDVSQSIQVINITHLPQIASKGDYHFFVYKETGDAATSTQIKLLNAQERISEIAKMLSGKNITDAAIKNAKALLNN
ncbi:DNA repair protein RecN [uncultured Acetobacteroides sp.]|uniref:DNA repair protein RecN n=1 Tax=uncultured Acetobacteroides sp. TaxID=1760811 RepID=UPI0029F496F9|nr:DNA repair protein RecN [uncultured Acetobacteroides sp.]